MHLRRLLLVLPAVLAAGCASTAGQLPLHIVDLARQTRTGGTFALEVDARGDIVGAEAEVEVAHVPQLVIDAAQRLVPGPATGAERELVPDGSLCWEVIKSVNGRAVELLFDDEGRQLGREEELERSAWPEAVVAAAERAVPGGSVTTVELVTGPEALGGTEHHVKKDVGGELLRISVLSDGSVGRVVRKIHAEFKSPR